MSDPKKVVEKGYDELAESYMTIRNKDFINRKYLDLFMEALPRGAKVLDLGCGCGIPLTRELAKKFHVTGIDISGKQIELARKNVPGALFIKQDMTDMKFPDGSFDGVFSNLAIIHVPRDETAGLFGKIYALLKSDGIILTGLGSDDWVSEPDDDFLGTPMYWSHFSPETSERIIEDTGFEILLSSIEDTSFDGQQERHFYVLARKSQ